MANTSAQKYTGTIKLPGMAPFPFDTKAVSEAKARNNGLSQYAKHLNMSIANLQRHLKLYTPTIQVTVTDEEH